MYSLLQKQNELRFELLPKNVKIESGIKQRLALMQSHIGPLIHSVQRNEA